MEPLCPEVARRALSLSLPISGCKELSFGRSSSFCWLAFCSDCAAREGQAAVSGDHMSHTLYGTASKG